MAADASFATFYFAIRSVSKCHPVGGERRTKAKGFRPGNWPPANFFE